MLRLRVAVLRGGPSSEYDVSLKTGAAVLRNLNEEKYIPRDVFIDREGWWHVHGMPKEPGDILENSDVVFNALHGTYGEDGTVQKILDRYHVPYTGSRRGQSALCMNKMLTKQALFPYQSSIPILFAKHAVIEPGLHMEDQLEEIFASFKKPIVVKPLVGGSSVGVTIASDFEELYQGVEQALELSSRAFLEEHITGREATCGVLEGFRGQDLYALLPVEIVPAEKCKFFDYEAKYQGASQEICPGRFSEHEKDTLQLLTSRVHSLLGLRHYSRSDFIIGRDGIYFLEVNTLPALMEETLLPQSLSAVGSSLPQFLDHVIDRALVTR